MKLEQMLASNPLPLGETPVRGGLPVPIRSRNGKCSAPSLQMTKTRKHPSSQLLSSRVMLGLALSVAAISAAAETTDAPSACFQYTSILNSFDIECCVLHGKGQGHGVHTCVALETCAVSSGRLTDTVNTTDLSKVVDFDGFSSTAVSFVEALLIRHVHTRLTCERGSRDVFSVGDAFWQSTRRTANGSTRASHEAPSVTICTPEKEKLSRKYAKQTSEALPLSNWPMTKTMYRSLRKFLQDIYSNAETFKNSSLASRCNVKITQRIPLSVLATMALALFAFSISAVSEVSALMSFDVLCSHIPCRPRKPSDPFYRGLQLRRSFLRPVSLSGSSVFMLSLVSAASTVLFLLQPIQALPDLRQSIIDGNEDCFRYISEKKLFQMHCSVLDWVTQGYARDTYISLGTNEVFEGASTMESYIDLGNIEDFDGLFKINADEVTKFADAPVIKNVHVRNGRLAQSGGFIVQNGQKNFIIDSCSSTGDITNYYSGGICGFRCGQDNGQVMILNSFSTGTIEGPLAGGITGNEVGRKNGRVNITQCYSTGTVKGNSAGGICAGNAGAVDGIVYIKQSYSTGDMDGPGTGGIVGLNARGYIHIQGCYTTGQISGQASGGITGPNAAQGDGQVHILDSYTRGNIVGDGAGGITGLSAGRQNRDGDVHITNTYASGIVKHGNAGGIIGSISSGFDSTVHTVQVQYSVYNKAEHGKIIGSDDGGHLDKTGNSDDLNEIRGKLYHFDGVRQWDNDTWVVTGPDVLPILRFQLPPTPSPSPTSTMTTTPSPTNSKTASVSASTSPTSSATPSRTASRSGSKTPTVTSSPTTTETATASTSASASASETVSPTSSRTPSQTSTSSSTTSRSPSSSATMSPSATPSSTPSPTASSTRSETPTLTSTFTPSETPTSSASASGSGTISISPTSSNTPSQTSTSSSTTSLSPSPSATMSPSETPTSSASASESGTISPTSSSTPSQTSTSSSTTSLSPSPSATMSPSTTPSFPPSPTATCTRSETPSGSETLSATLSNSAASIPTSSHTAAFTQNVPVPATATATSTPTPTRTQPRTSTPMRTQTRTITSSRTSSRTPTSTTTPSPTNTPAPQVIGPTCLNEFETGVTISFDFPTDRGGTPISFGCIDLLFSDIGENDNPFQSCVWVTRKQLSVFLRPNEEIRRLSGAGIQSGSTLFIREAMIRRTPNSAYMPMTPVNISAPAPLPEVSFTVEYQTIIPLCVDARLELLSITGGGRGEGISWTWSLLSLVDSTGDDATPTVKNATRASLLEATEQNAQLVQLESTLLANGHVYRILVTGENEYGYSLSQETTFEVESSRKPNIVFDEVPSDPTTGSSTSRYLTTVTLDVCDTLDNASAADAFDFSFDWSIKAPTDISLNTTSFRVADPRRLVIPPGTLLPFDNAYEVSFAVEAVPKNPVQDTLQAERKKPLQVTPSKMQSIIGGGNRAASSSEDLVVDGSLSTNPDSLLDLPSDWSMQFSFAWSCTFDDTVNASCDHLLLHDNQLSTSEATLVVNSSYLMQLQSKFNNPEEILITFSLQANSSLFRGGNGSSIVTSEDVSNVSIVLLQGETPAVSVVETNPNKPKMNPGDEIALQMQVDSNSKPTKELWELIEGEFTDDQTLEDVAVTDLSKPLLILDAGNTVAGSTYLFKFSSSFQNSALEGFGTVSVTVNDPPRGGNLNILKPTTADAVVTDVTDITFSVRNWVDEDLPLTYSYFVSFSGDPESRTVLNPASKSPTYTAKIPTPPDEDTTNVLLIVDIRDSLDAVTTMYASLDVEQPGDEEKVGIASGLSGEADVCLSLADFSCAASVISRGSNILPGEANNRRDLQELTSEDLYKDFLEKYVQTQNVFVSDSNNLDVLQNMVTGLVGKREFVTEERGKVIANVLSEALRLNFVDGADTFQYSTEQGNRLVESVSQLLVSDAKGSDEVKSQASMILRSTGRSLLVGRTTGSSTITSAGSFSGHPVYCDQLQNVALMSRKLVLNTANTVVAENGRDGVGISAEEFEHCDGVPHSTAGNTEDRALTRVSANNKFVSSTITGNVLVEEWVHPPFMKQVNFSPSEGEARRQVQQLHTFINDTLGPNGNVLDDSFSGISVEHGRGRFVRSSSRTLETLDQFLRTTLPSVSENQSRNISSKTVTVKAYDNNGEMLSASAGAMMRLHLPLFPDAFSFTDVLSIPSIVNGDAELSSQKVECPPSVDGEPTQVSIQCCDGLTKECRNVTIVCTPARSRAVVEFTCGRALLVPIGLHSDPSEERGLWSDEGTKVIAFDGRSIDITTSSFGGFTSTLLTVKTTDFAKINYVASTPTPTPTPPGTPTASSTATRSPSVTRIRASSLSSFTTSPTPSQSATESPSTTPSSATRDQESIADSGADGMTGDEITILVSVLLVVAVLATALYVFHRMYDRSKTTQRQSIDGPVDGGAVNTDDLIIDAGGTDD